MLQRRKLKIKSAQKEKKRKQRRQQQLKKPNKPNKLRKKLLDSPQSRQKKLSRISPWPTMSLLELSTRPHSKTSPICTDQRQESLLSIEKYRALN